MKFYQYFTLEDGSITLSKLADESIIFLRAPIGTIMPFLKDLSGVPTLPQGWVECNGQTITDTDSPLYGYTVPDLNGENRFLRGNSTSGGTGGSETHKHEVMKNYNTSGADKYRVLTYSSTLKGYLTAGDNTYLDSHRPDPFYSSEEDNKPPFYNVVWIIRIK